jgi:hypothetical protein
VGVRSRLRTIEISAAAKDEAALKGTDVSKDRAGVRLLRTRDLPQMIVER